MDNTAATDPIRRPETILGVLGGLGPAASADFLRLLARLAPAERDQDHPVVCMYSNPQIPDRSAAILGRGPSPEGDLKTGLLELCRWGAGLLAVPCNTAHFFIDRFRDELPVPLVHIVDATVTRAMRASPRGAWLIATGGTLASGLYPKKAAELGYRFLEPGDDVKALVTDAIALVKAGRLPESGEVMKTIVARLRDGADLPVVGACTELPLAYDASGLPPEGMVSSLDSLARECVGRLYGREI